MGFENNDKRAWVDRIMQASKCPYPSYGLIRNIF